VSLFPYLRDSRFKPPDESLNDLAVLALKELPL
jgi:hypothetical protein